MKIQGDLQGLQQISGLAEVSVSKKQPAETNTANASEQTVEAHLSDAAQLVSQAVALPDVRSDKIASVQAALAKGSYTVASSEVAARLMDHMSNQR